MTTPKKRSTRAKTDHTPEQMLETEMSRDAVLFSDEMLKAKAAKEHAGIKFTNIAGQERQSRVSSWYGPLDTWGYWVIGDEYLYDTNGSQIPIPSSCFDFNLTRGSGMAEARHLGMSLDATMSSFYSSLRPEKASVVISASGKILKLINHNCFRNTAELEVFPANLYPSEYVNEPDLVTFDTADAVLGMWRRDLQAARDRYGARRLQADF